MNEENTHELPFALVLDFEYAIQRLDFACFIQSSDFVYLIGIVMNRHSLDCEYQNYREKKKVHLNSFTVLHCLLYSAKQLCKRIYYYYMHMSTHIVLQSYL